MYRDRKLVKLDDLDRKLISQLRRDGRLTNRYLSDHLGASRITVQNRIRRLIKSEVIKITLKIDMTKGNNPIGAVIGLKVAQKAVDLMMDGLTNSNMVNRVAKTDGRFNLIVLASFMDSSEMSEFMLNLSVQNQQLMNSETFIIFHRKDAARDTVRDIDEKDRTIMGVLREDGRRSARDISLRLGLTTVTTQRRIKRLINDGWIKPRAVINPSKVNWYWPAVLGISVHPPYILEVFAKVKAHPEIGMAFCTLGSYDIIADVDGAESLNRLHEIAEDDILQIRGVRDCELFIFQETKDGRAWQL